MENLSLKGYMGRIGQLVYKTHSAVQYLVNKFKYTGSIKHVPRKQKRRILSARKERYKVNKIRNNQRLSASKLRGIVENTTRKPVCNQIIRRVIRKYGFHDRKLKKRPFVDRKTR